MTNLSVFEEKREDGLLNVVHQIEFLMVLYCYMKSPTRSAFVLGKMETQVTGSLKMAGTHTGYILIINGLNHKALNDFLGK